MNNKYTYISSATTTICRSTPGKLHAVTVNGGTAGSIVGYDNASAATGNVVFSFDSTNALATYRFDVDLVNGLVIVTGAATKVTVACGTQGD
jgi:hypothetical protein